MAGHSSTSICMSGQTPVAISWPMARTTSTVTPCRRHDLNGTVGQTLGVRDLG
jgi:hypothetical protein